MTRNIELTSLTFLPWTPEKSEANLKHHQATMLTTLVKTLMFFYNYFFSSVCIFYLITSSNVLSVFVLDFHNSLWTKKTHDYK